ncbi:MAG: SDR family oxidoreductase [candidate division Zixibacteria bacterium]|nr:SDR family oxidoreductase [candidate division Zixibacteria bacterium]
MALLDGKKTLISGVANKKSIAWGIAQALHAYGSQIAFACHPTNLRRVRKLAPEVDSEIIIPCDVGKDEEIAQAFDQVGNVFDGKLDILVHSIAYANLDDLGGEFIKTSRSGWNLALDISAYSLVVLARCARPLMKAAREGSIMTLTFGDGKVVPGYNIMGVAKAALEMAVRYLAYDLGPENIRVNAIASGPIQTISSLAIEDFSVALCMMEERSPLLRNVTLEDVGRTAVYLASDFSKAVTGSVIKVDSGMNIMSPPTAPHRKLKEAYDAWLKQARNMK